VERGTVRVKCLAQEHNTITNPASAQAQTGRNRKLYKNKITRCLHRLLIYFKMDNH